MFLFQFVVSLFLFPPFSSFLYRVSSCPIPCLVAIFNFFASMLRHSVVSYCSTSFLSHFCPPRLSFSSSSSFRHLAFVNRSFPPYLLFFNYRSRAAQRNPNYLNHKTNLVKRFSLPRPAFSRTALSHRSYVIFFVSSPFAPPFRLTGR